MKEVTAVIVLSWSMEIELEHLEAKAEAAKRGIESEVGKKEYWDDPPMESQSTRNRVMWLVSSYPVLVWNENGSLFHGAQYNVCLIVYESAERQGCTVFILIWSGCKATRLKFLY